MRYYNLIDSDILSNTVIIKKSKFITYIRKISSLSDGDTFLEEIRSKYRDASHICYVFIEGSPTNLTKCKISDDGEPKGSATKLIVSTLIHMNVGDLAVIVVRYFGGIKLGVGGLNRGYAASLGTLLLKEKLKFLIDKKQLIFSIDYQDSVKFNNLFEKYFVQLDFVNYLEKVKYIIFLEDRYIEAFKADSIEITKGSILYEE
ncbi:MAG: YigZ family protein [Psittacicella sp.]